ncbi:hypothetical protein GT347_01770 [Xylophilus rhododendri]|uniref:DoxX family protein n=1 Tax=Xylophilus rhododendri TaxID=2697032 RepID=A0A857J1I5_9BURK|nr:hypothetical protein [Xylophilus rhododendri]QHI96828.1 hypothetical protein GT347_01770 [Xylophilus rhododendri]
MRPPLPLGKKLGLASVFLWFFIGGIAHFMFADAEARIVPEWIPWPETVVFVSGILELLGAAGLLFCRTRSAAGWGLILLTVAVTPANIFMLQHAADFPNVPLWALVARLPLQVGLAWLIYWSAAQSRRRRSGAAA